MQNEASLQLQARLLGRPIKHEKHAARKGGGGWRRAYPVRPWNDEDKIQTRESPHLRIVERRLQGKTYKAIAEEVGLTKCHMENCARITKLMEEVGLPEPYRRLTEKPDRVPQWCSKHWLKAGERKGGGKRRRAS